MGLANYCVPAGEAYQKALDIAFEITQKGMEASLLQKTLKKDGISFLSEAVTVVRVRIECRLLTETFMYHRSYCSKVKEQHSANMTHAEDALKNSWVYHVEMMVTEFCAICIKRNLVDKMMDLPWDSEEEKHLHKSLFDSAQEMPMKPNGSLLVVYYLRDEVLTITMPRKLNNYPRKDTLYLWEYVEDEMEDSKSPKGRQKLFSNEEKILLNKRVPDLETATSFPQDGLPAIHKAILSKKAAIINYLLRNSANPFIQDKVLPYFYIPCSEELICNLEKDWLPSAPAIKRMDTGDPSNPSPLSSDPPIHSHSFHLRGGNGSKSARAESVAEFMGRNETIPSMKDLLARNAMLAEELLRTGGGMTTDTSQKPSSGRERVQIEALRQELEGAKRQIGALKSEKSQIEAKANNQRNLSVKLESDLKSLSEAYNNIEQANYRLDAEVKAL
ncbi:E3 ubiquitin-protein ligase HOS1, partial [Zea mays]